MPAKPWLGYLRVSKVGDPDGDSFRSVSDQAEEMRAWAKRRGEAITILDPELNESGGRADRPFLTSAVEATERSEERGEVNPTFLTLLRITSSIEIRLSGLIVLYERHETETVSRTRLVGSAHD